MNTAKHLSSFELDVYHASSPAERDSTTSAEIAEHVASCGRCREYLDELEALASEPSLAPARPAPAHLPRAEPLSPPAAEVLPLRPSPKARMQRRLAAASAVLALAAGVVLYAGSRASAVDDEARYVGVKGVPAAQVLLRRDGRVRVWDGVTPVRPGDAIAVSVACEHFSHVTVAAGAESTPTRAWEGTCPSAPRAATLPFTLVVDAQPGREQFSVVLSRKRLDDERLRTVLRGAMRDGDAWTIDFAFAKEEK